MIKILGNRILVSKVEEAETDGFQTVEVQDSFVNKGKVEACSWPEEDMPYKIGDIVLFAKYSPDTQEIDHEGKKYKIISVNDVLAVI